MPHPVVEPSPPPRESRFCAPDDAHGFRGYIHLTAIPGADERLLAEAGRHADRLSVNIELPKPEGLKALAPEKDARDIRRAMGRLRSRIEEAASDRGAPRFAPSGQRI